jgi:ABC-2 type transport system permease protein
MNSPAGAGKRPWWCWGFHPAAGVLSHGAGPQPQPDCAPGGAGHPRFRLAQTHQLPVLALHPHLFPLGLPDLIFGLIMIAYAGSRLGLPVTAYGLGIPPLLLGFISLYSLWFMLGATSIWFVKIYNVTEVLRGLLEAGRFPIGAYPVAYRVFFTFVIPVAFLTTVPAQAVLGQGHWGWLLGSAGLSLLLLQISRWFWQFALRFYTSASS